MFATFTLGHRATPTSTVRTPVEQLQPFERGCIVDLREAGWTYRRIATHVGHSVSVVYRCFQQWSVEHTHTCRPGSGRPHVNIDALCEQRWPPEQYPGKEFGHMLHLLSPKTIGNRVLAAGLRSNVTLPWLPLTPRHRQARVFWCHETINWNVTLLSSVMRAGSVYMRVMDVDVYGVDLVSVSFRSAFAHDIQAPPQTSWCGAINLQLALTFGVSAG